MHSLYTADNLEWLPLLANESVDCCYIDPPFFSGRDFGQFSDKFSSVQHYIQWMRPRIELIHQKLKKTGSIFLHCDWHASHRLRCLLDDVFGEENFKNQIIWKRCDSHNDAKKQFPMTHDEILFYSKTRKHFFQKIQTSYSLESLKKRYLSLEFPDGTTRRMTKEEIETQVIPKNGRRFTSDNLVSPNPRPHLTYPYKGHKPHKNGWRVSLQRMEELDKENLLIFPKTLEGRIFFKRYLDTQNGPMVSDLWLNIVMLRGTSQERLGYPTQKPEALIKRIIECSTSPGDLVLDCFLGSGTTAKVALEMGRRFVGGDINPEAIKITEARISGGHFR